YLSSDKKTNSCLTKFLSPTEAKLLFESSAHAGKWELNQLPSILRQTAIAYMSSSLMKRSVSALRPAKTVTSKYPVFLPQQRLPMPKPSTRDTVSCQKRQSSHAFAPSTTLNLSGPVPR